MDFHGEPDLMALQHLQCNLNGVLYQLKELLIQSLERSVHLTNTIDEFFKNNEDNDVSEADDEHREGLKEMTLFDHQTSSKVALIKLVSFQLDQYAEYMADKYTMGVSLWEC